jgi:hypothetical protein
MVVALGAALVVGAVPEVLACALMPTECTATRLQANRSVKSSASYMSNPVWLAMRTFPSIPGQSLIPIPAARSDPCSRAIPLGVDVPRQPRDCDMPAEYRNHTALAGA